MMFQAKIDSEMENKASPNLQLCLDQPTEHPSGRKEALRSRHHLALLLSMLSLQHRVNPELH